jgi:uncharacterized protein (TIRG00374 family)
VQPGALARQFAGTDTVLFSIALVTAMVANLASAWRWAIIARLLGLTAPTFRLVLMYARGVATNAVLPGATLSGDLLRSYQLASLGNAFSGAALSVLLDRISGLWVLCILSLVAAIALPALAREALPPGVAWYAALLLAAVALPLLVGSFRIRARSGGERLQRLRRWLGAARKVTMQTVGMSVGVQLLSVAALWLCGLAVGMQLSYVTMLAAAAPVFVMAAVPLAVAGFGTRELAAVLVFGSVGVLPEQAAACALLYGACILLQGMLASPLLLVKA